MTYGQVAATAGFPRAARLTVRALYSSERLPWHRVVGAGGRISLRGADGQEQRLRLQTEGVRFIGNRVPLERFGWSPGRGGRSGPVAVPRGARRPVRGERA